MAYNAPSKKVLTMSRVNTPIARFEEVGRLYKGNPKPERGPGRDYASSYLRFEPADRFTREASATHANMAEEMKARWESIIKTGAVKIIFPFASIAEVFPVANRVTKMVGASAKTMVACDPRTGRNTKWVEDQIINGKTAPKVVAGDRPCQASDDGVCPLGCIPRAMLKISIPELWPGGIVLFPMGSIIDIGNILGALQPYDGIDLRGVPSWSLFRKEEQISWEDPAKGTQTKANWGINLTIDPQITAKLAAQQQRQFLRSIDEDAPAIAPTAQKVIAPARLRQFRGSADHQAMQAAMEAAAKALDSEGVTAALVAALEMIDGGFYDEAGRSIINGAWELAQDRIATRRHYGQQEANPKAFAAAVAAEPEEEPIELIDPEEAKAFWETLKAMGWDLPTLKTRLEPLGYQSLKAVPADLWGEVSEALLATMPK